MRHTAAALVALLVVSSLSAGTISSISPTSYLRDSGEEFLTIDGTDLGNRVRFVGPAGTFEVDINANTGTTRVITWVPLEVLAVSGTYSVTVLGGRSGDSGPVSLPVGTLKWPKFTLLLPEFIIIESLFREGMHIKYEVHPFGGEDPNPVVECDPPSGSLFKIGISTVQCTASNSNGERASGSFSVNAYDAPPFWVSADGLVAQTKEDGAFVEYRVTVADTLDGELKAVCSPESGSFFRIGKTPVRCTATDSANNLADATFEIEVEDVSGVLKIHLPKSLTAEADLPEGGHPEWDAWTSGTDDPEVEIRCDPESGSLFPFDFTSVYCVANDRFGQSAEGKFEVNVIDSTPPTLQLAVADPNWLSPDGSMVPVRLNVEASDLVDPKPQCAVVDVTANEPITEKDWRILDELTVELRATMSEKTDRIYSVNLQCVDVRQNRSAGSASVVVSQEKPPEPLSAAAAVK